MNLMPKTPKNMKSKYRLAYNENKRRAFVQKMITLRNEREAEMQYVINSTATCSVRTKYNKLRRNVKAKVAAAAKLVDIKELNDKKNRTLGNSSIKEEQINTNAHKTKLEDGDTVNTTSTASGAADSIADISLYHKSSTLEGKRCANCVLEEC